MVLVENWFAQWLGEHVYWLIEGVDGMQGDFAPLDVVPEVVELDIDVLDVKVHLWDLGDFKSTAVVLRDLKMNH